MRLYEAKRKCITYVFILCLMLGALCVDKIQVDSLWDFGGVASMEAASFANFEFSAHTLWSLEDFLFQQTEVSPILNIKRDNKREALRIFVYLWSVIIFLQTIMSSLWRQERHLRVVGESLGRIICFIHQKDGEKEEHILPVCV